MRPEPATPTSAAPGQLRLSGGLVDLDRFQVLREGEIVPLTQREVDLLRYFVANPHRAIPRRELLGEVWGYAAGVRTRATDNAIVRLRTKVEARPDDPENILSVRGIGYRFEFTEAAPAPLRLPPPPELPELEPTRFFGRTRSLQTLDALLARTSLVTIVGAPGIGKTRLARHYASGWKGPVWFADLSAATSLSHVVHAVAAALDLRLDAQQGPKAAVDQLGRALASHEDGLLILDSFEPVAALAPHCLARWIRVAPQRRFLATSRERLLVAGEHCLELGPLQPDDAVALFRDRAQATGRTLDEDPTALRDVVGHLDGLPLALELAASRVHVLSLDALVERLQQLGTGRRDVSPRHRTLRAAFRWSWDLLDAEERDALAQLALFEAPFSLEAAEAVVDGPVLDLLEGLRNKSMLERASDGRFQMLGIIRGFVRDEAGEPPDGAAARHVGWTIARVEDLVAGLHGRDAIQCAQALAHELDDQLGALRRATPDQAVRLLLALEESPALNSVPHLRLEWVERVLSQAERPNAELLRVRAGLLMGIRQLDEADAILDEAEAMAGDDDTLRGNIDAVRGGILEYRGDRAGAASVLARAVARLRPDRRGLIDALIQLGRMRFDPGRYSDAEAVFQEALGLARSAGDALREGRLLGHLGMIAQTRRAFEEADRYFAQSLECARAFGDRGGIVIQTIYRGGLLVYLDPSPEQHRALHDALVEALDTARRLGRLDLQVAATETLLQMAVADENLEEGAALIASLPADWTEATAVLRAMTWCTIAAIHHLGGAADETEAAYRSTIESFEETGHMQWVWRATCFLALFLAEQDRWDEAATLFDAAIAGHDGAVAAWLEDIRDTARLLHLARQDPGQAAALRAQARVPFVRVKAGEALKSLQNPVRSSHRWIVRLLERGLEGAKP